MDTENSVSQTPFELNLANLLTRQTMEARVTVSGWEEAADRVGSLLVQAGRVEPSYTQAMKRVLQEMGPYAVIAPGIVLLHARPEDGVCEPCLGLITLATPVEFGHTENDPVDLVFALGAQDKQAHISALQQLAEMLGDEDMLARLRAAADTQSLYDAVRSWPKGA